MQIRNTPSPVTGKVDIIDRHTKNRCVIIDIMCLMAYNSMDISMLIMDIAELSDYYDCIVICPKGKEADTEVFLEHWGLNGKVMTEYMDKDEILDEYKILTVFTTRQKQDRMKEYYHTTVFAK